MFENILWAKTVEKAGESVDKISMASVETVLKNLDRLANLNMWSIGILLGIAGLFVGYNLFVSESKIRRLKKEFNDQIRLTQLLQGADFERHSAAFAIIAKKFDFASVSWASAIQVYLRAELLAKDEDTREKTDDLISECFKMLKYSLKECKERKQELDEEKTERIEKYISKAPQEKREQINELLK